MTGTEWDLVYTNSKGSSSGKIGPFVGRVKQVSKEAEMLSSLHCENAGYIVSPEVLISNKGIHSNFGGVPHAGVSG